MVHPVIPFVPPKRANFLKSYCGKQNWSIPDSIIYYMAKNPLSPKSYQKAIKTCKYFFVQNPILVVPTLHYFFGNDWVTQTSFYGTMSLNDTTSKFWVTQKFEFQNVPENFDCQHIISVIIPRIYQHNINYFQLFRVNIYFDDFVFLVSKCEAISLWNVTVKNKDGSVVALDKLIEVTPKLKHLTYNLPENSSNIIKVQTVRNLIEIRRFSRLREIWLDNVPDVFDIDNFYEHLKKNKKTEITIQFSNNISERYKARIQTIVNEINRTKVRAYRKPTISWK